VLREKLTYANVMATLAVFIALGGTSYAAIALPRNSVGTKQLRSGSVGKAELRARAVTSNKIRNGSVTIGDIAAATRDALRGDPGPAGPPGVALRAAINSGGTPLAGNATGSSALGGGAFVVEFGRNLAGCTPTATLARNRGGGVDDPGAGSIVVALTGGNVAVQTYNAAGTATNLPFNVLVAC
jgi:hypothetical protein